MYQGLGAFELEWVGSAPFNPDGQTSGAWWEEPVAILTESVEQRIERELGEPIPSTSPYGHPYEIPYADSIPQATTGLPSSQQAGADIGRVGTGGLLLLGLSAAAVIYATTARR